MAVSGLAVLVRPGAAGRHAPDGRAASGADTVLPAMERVLRRDGLAAALDSLERRAAGDSTLSRDGHQMAHALGREAVAEHGGDPSVVRECTPSFASGCYHGVVEAALSADRRIDMPKLERLCTDLTDTAGPGPGFECIHGLGHGVLGAREGNVRAALRDCDGLSTRRRVTSCHLGVFMEAVNDAVGASAISGGTGGTHEFHGGMHHQPAAGMAVDASRPYQPCEAFEDPYAASCWLFQGFVILRAQNFDAGRALGVCDDAPAARRARCYEGVGHQLTGLFQRNDEWIISQCGRGRPDLAAHCAAGATYALDAMDWTGGRAAHFCRAAPEAWKAACYHAAADWLVDLASPAARAAFCGKAEPPFAASCRQAAELPTAGAS